jgi:hypothetical protein
MLGDLRLHRRDLRHLPPLHPGYPCSAQARPAAAAAAWLVPAHVTGMIGQAHRRARLPLWPTGLAASLLPQRLRGGLAQPVRRGRPGGVLRVLLYPGGQVSHLTPQPLHLFPQLPGLSHLHPKLGDQLIAFGDQLPQPGVRGPQPGNRLSQNGRLTGYKGRIGHTPHSTTAGPPSSRQHAEPASVNHQKRKTTRLERDLSSYFEVTPEREWFHSKEYWFKQLPALAIPMSIRVA